MKQTTYVTLQKACQLIALDNGGINALRTGDQQKSEYETWLKSRTENLSLIDSWLAGLSAADLEVVCCGELTAAQSLLGNAPQGTTNLLDAYLNEVC